MDLVGHKTTRTRRRINRQTDRIHTDKMDGYLPIGRLGTSLHVTTNNLETGNSWSGNAILSSTDTIVRLQSDPVDSVKGLTVDHILKYQSTVKGLNVSHILEYQSTVKGLTVSHILEYQIDSVKGLHCESHTRVSDRQC